MQGSDQEINKQLHRINQQEESNHIRWLLAKNTRRKFYHYTPEEDISQWSSQNEEYSHIKRGLSLLRQKRKEKSTRYTYMMDILGGEEDKSFQKYEHLPAYNRKLTEKIVSPKRIDLKLPLPKVLTHSSNLDKLQQREISLPLMKKVAIPVNFLRSIDKKREKSLGEVRESAFLLREQSQQMWRGRSKEDQDDYNPKGRLMGATRRQLKSFNSFCLRTPRNPQQTQTLKQCLIFRK